MKDERSDILLDIFNLPDLKPDSQDLHLPLLEEEFIFVKRERFSEETVDGVLDTIIEFIKEVLGEREDEYYSEDMS